ncbi:MAG: alanine racemase [Thermoanaerobaculales bacterium]|jgi:alanine racemase|nr:alanine racemase [Thermoanaerobaculales bacterium]
MADDFFAPTQWIELDPSALAHNARVFRSALAPTTRLLGVVKANAYGHGLEVVAPEIAKHVDWLGVHSATEARALREIGTALPILVMGYVPPVDLRDLDSGIHLLVSSPTALKWVADYRDRSGVSLPVHIKVDTGAKRQGVPEGAIGDMARTAGRYRLEVVGVATHFANIEDTLEHQFARTQLERFQHAVAEATSVLGVEPPFIHAACSAASLLFRQTDFTLVRVGISLYGHWPSRETKLSWILEHGRGGVELQPVLSWRAQVGQLQPVGKGESVGYGRTWTALRDTVLAVIPVGYADGYPRALGNRSRVAIRGCAAPVVGRVCMNIMMADVTDIPGVEIGDRVTLLGADGGATVTAEDLAALCGSINYEVLARLSPEIPRRLAS